MSETFYITTPIYYPNGEPHLGSVYTTVICDVVARYHRLKGERTYFLTGTDEHGTKMAKAAEAEGAPPQQLADKYSKVFADVWEELGITNDDFIRTTEARHKNAVSRIVKRMIDVDDIYLGSYEGWYDEGQEQFVTETEAKTSDFKSPISRRPLVRYKEPTYFFRLRKYVPRLVEYIQSNEQFIIPITRRNEVLSKLKAGVEDLSISRGTLKWGIPMPHDPDHVLYVWIDALTNYITALGYESSNDELFRKFWPGTHVIGKDILWFHAVYWPAMLFSLGLELPKTVAAHGWWVRGGVKAGKSTGGITSIDEIRAVSTKYSFDAVRFHLLRAGTFGGDLEWSDDELQKSFNELANVVGNCLNRTIKMIGKKCEGAIPARGELSQIDQDLLARNQRFGSDLSQSYETFELQQAVLLPVELARATNGYIDATQPFKEPDPSRVDTILNLSAQAIKNALVGLLPVLPDKAKAGLAQLQVQVEGKTLKDLLETELMAGHKLGEGQPLFPKVENAPGR
jgi:methionyl-tRNA synthetase